MTGGFTGTGDLILNVNGGASSGGAITISGSSVNMTGAITNNGLGTSVGTISAVIGPNVTRVVQNSATSKLTLTGVNTYTGDTVINAGLLALGHATAITNSTVYVNVNDGLGFTVNATTIGGLSGAGNFGLTNGASAVTLSVGNNNANTTYSGIMGSSGGIIKVGTGTLILSGASTYSGGTTISGGTVKLVECLTLMAPYRVLFERGESWQEFPLLSPSR
jgi:autotransporter-associated beta strand protein